MISKKNIFTDHHHLDYAYMSCSLFFNKYKNSHQLVHVLPFNASKRRHCKALTLLVIQFNLLTISERFLCKN